MGIWFFAPRVMPLRALRMVHSEQSKQSWQRLTGRKKIPLHFLAIIYVDRNESLSFLCRRLCHCTPIIVLRTTTFQLHLRWQKRKPQLFVPKAVCPFTPIIVLGTTDIAPWHDILNQWDSHFFHTRVRYDLQWDSSNLIYFSFDLDLSTPSSRLFWTSKLE